LGAILRGLAHCPAKRVAEAKLSEDDRQGAWELYTEIVYAGGGRW
jgi:hypothetical protein